MYRNVRMFRGSTKSLVPRTPRRGRFVVNIDDQQPSYRGHTALYGRDAGKIDSVFRHGTDQPL